MKIKTISTLMVKVTLLVSFIYAGSVSPMLSLRFDDVAGSNDLIAPSQTLGLKMEVGEGVYSGFDTDGSDFRIFVQQSFAFVYVLFNKVHILIQQRLVLLNKFICLGSCSTTAISSNVSATRTRSFCPFSL